MRLVQSRFVTDNVERLAAFYGRLFGVPVALNDYYVEIQAGPPPTADHGPAVGGGPARPDEVILDLLVDDVDAEYPRVAALGVDWVLPPTTQPWGTRSMIFRDPAGNLVNVFSR